MSLVEHIGELRRRIIISLVALAVGTVVGYIWYQNGVSLGVGSARLSIPTLGDILRGPYCSLPPDRRASFSADGTCKLLATGPFDMFMLRLKVGALAGAVFSSPVWLWQIWRFVTPGLYRKERRITLAFVTCAVILFTAGAVLAYYIIAVGLDFLLSIGDETQTAALNGLQYYNFLLVLLVIFGLSFEVPLFIAMLNLVGVLPYSAVKDKRRIIIVGIFIFAAFATPGQDPVSMTVLGAVLVLLVELAFQFCRLNDKRRVSERPDWMDLDDEQASPLGEGAGAIGVPEPIGPVTPIRPAAATPRPPVPGTSPRPAGPPPAPQGPGGIAGGTSLPSGPVDPTDFDDVL